MRTTLAMIASICTFAIPFIALTAGDGGDAQPAGKSHDGWRLAVQAWTFNKFTFTEAVAV